MGENLKETDRQKEESITVVVPCFNEGKTIYQNIKKIAQYLKGKFEHFEIIAVNDGSNDGTINELKKIQLNPHFKIIDNKKNAGKGKAVKDGVLASNNGILMFLDADLAIPIEELKNFLIELKNGYDVLIASRFMPGSKIIIPVMWYRKIMEKVFRALRMIIINDYDVKDTQCGFKIFKGGVAEKIFPLLTTKRFAFEAEVIFVAKKLGFKIKELPVALQNPKKSRIRIFRDPFNMFFDLLKIRLNDFLGKYKLPSQLSNVF